MEFYVSLIPCDTVNDQIVTETGFIDYEYAEYWGRANLYSGSPTADYVVSLATSPEAATAVAEYESRTGA